MANAARKFRRKKYNQDTKVITKGFKAGEKGLLVSNSDFKSLETIVELLTVVVKLLKLNPNPLIEFEKDKPPQWDDFYTYAQELRFFDLSDPKKYSETLSKFASQQSAVNNSADMKIRV